MRTQRIASIASKRSIHSVLLLSAVLIACGDGPATPPQLPIAAKLGFVTQPGTTEGQVEFTPSIRVAVQDQAGNTVTGDAHAVTLTLSPESGSAALEGTLTVQTVNGIATFSDVRIAEPGESYVLQASSPGLSMATSEPFATRLTFAQVSVGGFHSCGVTTPGFAYCWGNNAAGQLGDGSTSQHETPVAVVGSHRFAQVSSGRAHTCGVTVGGAAYCWGLNEQGRLGDGTDIARSTPTIIAGGISFVGVSAGDVHSCGIASDGVAYCWGSNANGQLGQGAISGAALTPVTVAASKSFVKIGANGAHTCAITADAEAYCWGDNSVGQLGDGSTSAQLEPAPVSGNLRFVEISLGSLHTCAVTTSKALYCWGYNNHGQGGDGTFTQREEPTLVTMIAGSVESAAAGMIHSCATTSAGAGYCWGANFDGRVGDGTVSYRDVPTQVSGDHSFSQIAAGESHSCGLTHSGVLYCWGFNAWGQLGDGTDQSSLVPKRVAH